jgi:TolB-like protein/Flp pilus assembly protein TadD
MKFRFRNLIQELRDRSVFRATVTYAVVAWMLLQVADVTFDRLPLPDASMTVLIVLVLIGFPVTITLAWAYEITVRGLVRHEETNGGVSRMAFAPFVVLTVILTGGAGFGLYQLSRSFFEPPAPSIAVLPFANFSQSADDEYFSDGLTEEIQSLLVRINEFRVVALNSSYQMKDTVLDMRSIARRLSVNVLLQGNVRRSGTRLRITARLIDGDDGFELWSDSYDRQVTDIFAIQEDIARQVAGALDIALPADSNDRFAKLGTTAIESYDFYLRALDELRRPKDDVTIAAAEDYLGQAIAIDGNFAKAYAALCETYLVKYEWSRATEQFENAERACHRALTRDNESSDVHLALGRLYYSSGQYDDSIAVFQKALEVTPNSADSYIGLGKAYAKTNRLAEAESSYRQAIELDPSYWASFNEMGNFLYAHGRFLEAARYYNDFARRAEDNASAYNNLGAAHYLAGNFSRAAEAWEESLAIKPTRSAYSNSGSMHFYLGNFLTAVERYARAVNLAPEDYRLWGNLADAYFFAGGMKQVAEIAYQRAIDLAGERLHVNSADVDTMTDMAYYYARLGKKEVAEKLQGEAVSADPDNMYVNYNGALIHAHFGDKNQALSSLARAIQLDYQAELLQYDPGLESLRDEDEFKRLVAQRNN